MQEREFVMRRLLFAALTVCWFSVLADVGTFDPPPVSAGMCVEHVALDVAEPKATAKWWCENLGFHVGAKLPVPPYAIFIVNAAGNFAMELYRDPNTPGATDYRKMSPEKMHIAFVSDDLESNVRRLVAAGATLVSRTKNSGNELVMLRDPSGIPIQLVKRAVPLIIFFDKFPAGHRFER